MGSSSDFFLALIAVLFPPIAVWIKRSVCSLDSLLNILLCVLGYLPGLLHAWYIIAKYPDPDGYEAVAHDAEGGRVTYYYVGSDGHRLGDGAARMGPQGGRGEGGYGGTAQGGAVRLQEGGQGASQGASQGPSQGASQEAGAGVPPSYDDAVKGDNKVQT
ncbi:hypothetical protein MMC11_005191 [Xylographa trunciseda]|nr:hypothetical protein [Xylographa trunciseda]